MPHKIRHFRKAAGLTLKDVARSREQVVVIGKVIGFARKL